MPGFVEVRPVRSDEPIITQSRTYGMRFDAHSAVLGYQSNLMIAVPDGSKCHAVIVFERGSALTDEWRAFFDANPNICVRGEQ